MKKSIGLWAIFLWVSLSINAQTSISSKFTGLYSYGLFSNDQMVSDTGLDGVYDETKNGYDLNGSINISHAVFNFADLSLDLNVKHRLGSPYRPMELSPSAAASSSIGIGQFYGRVHISEVLFPRLRLLKTDTNMNVRVGKFSMSSPNPAISQFGTENSLNKVGLPSSGAVAFQTALTFSGARQYVNGSRATLSFNLASGGLFDESVPRLYDTDGGISNHGKIVLGEYAPQFLAQLLLNQYVTDAGTLSAGISYALNGGGIYSGSSLGINGKFSYQIEEDKYYLPVGLSVAYHEKNIDVLTGTTGSDLNTDTTDFRMAIKAGMAAGFEWVIPQISVIGPPDVKAEATIAGSFAQINHIYRDSLNIISLSLDGQYHLNPRSYLGGGFILGTLQDITWQTSEGVSAAFDAYNHSFALMDNMGYEVFAGLDMMSDAKLVVGYAHMKGLSMNYGAESNATGLVKARQKDSTSADGLWETHGIFIKTSVNY